MLVLDTNTFYYISNLSTSPYIDLPKFVDRVDATTQLCISSVSFGEFIARYRYNAKIIRRTCSFMLNYHINVRDQLIPFDNDIVKKLSKIRQKDLNSVVNTLLLVKSSKESGFAALVFCIVLFSETIFECNIDPYNVPDCVYDFFSKLFKDSLRPLLVELFKKIYFDAYKTDNAENIIRRDFHKYLRLFTSLCMPLCKHVLDEYEKLPIGAEVDMVEIMKEFSHVDWEHEMNKYQSKIDKEDTPSKFISKKGLKYGKSINDKHLTSLLNGLSNSLKNVITNFAIEEYLFSIIKNTLSNGGSFWKNDINDALILSTLTPNDVILSIDGDMREYIRKNSEAKIEYKNSITLIDSFINS